jgi:PAS domain S-box-containing protein
MILDLKLQDTEGKALVQRLTILGRCPPFIIVTGQGDERVAVEMMKSGAIDYIVKDVDFIQFIPSVVTRAFEQIDKERRLAQAEAEVLLIRSVVDQGFSAVCIITAEKPHPWVVYVNPAFLRITGYSAASVLGQPVSCLAGLGGIQEHLRLGMSRGEGFVDDVYPFQTGAGERWGEWRLGPVKDKAGLVTHWLIIFRDITERRRLEKETLEITDRERQRIGHDLHDGLCQQLAGIELMSEVLETKLASRNKSAAAQAAHIASHVREAIAQTRLLSRGLSPITLESEGLMSALKELALNTGKVFGIACHFICERSILIQDLAVATHVYRIAQEAVSNAIKHGRAKEVVIRLKMASNQAMLMVSDLGTGIAENLHESTGMGLRIMRYRAGMIGGTLKIERNQPTGTTVSCIFPGVSPAGSD